jgi:hypothetical protein
MSLSQDDWISFLKKLQNANAQLSFSRPNILDDDQDYENNLKNLKEYLCKMLRQESPSLSHSSALMRIFKNAIAPILQSDAKSLITDNNFDSYFTGHFSDQKLQALFSE